MDTAILQFFETIRCPALTAFFSFFSFLGESVPVAAAVVLVYWLSERRTAEQIAVTALTSLPLNVFLKETVARPRPYVTGTVSLLKVDTPLFSTADLGDYVSFPSGHAQGTGSLLASVSMRAKRTWVWCASAAVVLLVMCSRVYFGVHHPGDVLAGLAIGVAVALLWEIVYRKAYGARYFLLTAFALLALVPILFSPSHDYLQTAGLLSGAALFLPLEDAFFHAETPRSRKKLWRIPAGGALLGAVFALSLLFPEGDGFTLLRWFLLSSAMTGGAQALFRLLRI